MWMEDNITSWQEHPDKAFNPSHKEFSKRVPPVSTSSQYLYTSLKPGRLRIKFSENDQKPQFMYKADAFI